MDIVLPEVPTGIVTLLGVVAVYFTSWLNAFINLTGWSKRIASVAMNLVLVAGSMVVYYWITKDPIPDLPTLILTGFAAGQVFYALVGKNTAKMLEENVRERHVEKKLVRQMTIEASVDPGAENHPIVPGEAAPQEVLPEDLLEGNLDPADAEILARTEAELEGRDLDAEEFVVDAHTGQERRTGNHE